MRADAGGTRTPHADFVWFRAARLCSSHRRGDPSERTVSEDPVVRRLGQLVSRICEEFGRETGGAWCYTATFGGG